MRPLAPCAVWAGIAQLVEYKLPKLGVAGSNPAARSTDAPLPKCLDCRKKMRRVISQTAFILKGSGWYVTDYPSEARKKGMEGEKPSAAPAADAVEKKKEPAKPAPAAPAAPPAAGPAAGKGRKKKP